MPLRFRKDLNLRMDANRVVVYQRASEEAPSYLEEFGWRLLHPNFAILVSLFDGAKSVEEIVREFAYLTDGSGEETKSMIDKFLESNGDLFEEAPPGEAIGSRYDPFAFLVDAESVDLSLDRLHLPIGCVWIVTLGCAFKCAYCYADIERVTDCSRGLMSLDQARRIIEQFDEMEFGRVGISGGDPFSHPHIFELLQMLRDSGYITEVPTKTPLNRAALQNLVDIGLTSVQFSLDSPLDGSIVADHLQIPNNGYLDQVRDSIHTAGNLGLMVAINAVITKRNIHHIEDMVRYYADLGFVYRLNLSQAGASVFRDFPQLMASREEYERYDAIVDRFKVEYPHMSTNLSWLKDPSEMTADERAGFFRERPRCSGGRWEFTLLPDGSMSLCEELYYHPEFIVGNVLQTPIAELWNSDRMLEILYPESEDIAHGPCGGCEFLHECNTKQGRCWIRALKAYRDKPDAHNWPDPYCPKAPAPLHRVC